MSARFRVVGPPKFVNLNGSHGNPHAHQHAMTAWLQCALVAARGCRPVDPPVTILAEVHRTNRARSDAHNVTPSIKACIDGAVKAGLIPDDNDDIVHALIIKRGDILRDARNKTFPAITITITSQQEDTP